VHSKKPIQSGPTRRQFLAFAGAGAAIAGGAAPGRAMAGYWRVTERKIALHNPWSEEYLDLAYWRDGRYLPGPLADFDYLLRDKRSGEVGEMFRGVFDQLFWLGRALGGDAPFGIVSGFRSISTNNMLRAHSEGVARNSLHTHGMAIDVRMAGVAEERIWQTAKELGLGGAGLYRRSSFVHLDVGPVRSWNV
jgi:uncharacterized protein YcbK (DUF882 family)